MHQKFFGCVLLCYASYPQSASLLFPPHTFTFLYNLSCSVSPQCLKLCLNRVQLTWWTPQDYIQSLTYKVNSKTRLDAISCRATWTAIYVIPVTLCCLHHTYCLTAQVENIKLFSVKIHPTSLTSNILTVQTSRQTWRSKQLLLLVNTTEL